MIRRKEAGVDAVHRVGRARALHLGSGKGPDGVLVREKKAVHRRGALREFLAGAEPGSRVAVETVGNWYWVTDEVEEAGCIPQLVAELPSTRL